MLLSDWAAETVFCEQLLKLSVFQSRKSARNRSQSVSSCKSSAWYPLSFVDRLAGLDRTDFSAVRSQSKRPDRETVSIFSLDRTETFIAQAFINKLG